MGVKRGYSSFSFGRGVLVRRVASCSFFLFFFLLLFFLGGEDRGMVWGMFAREAKGKPKKGEIHFVGSEPGTQQQPYWLL